MQNLRKLVEVVDEQLGKCPGWAELIAGAREELARLDRKLLDAEPPKLRSHDYVPKKGNQ